MTQANTGATSDVVGMYTHNDFESQSRLVLLDDNTFCLAFTGASMDLLKAGHWKFIDKNTVQLQETRREEPVHPAFAQNIDRLGPMMVGINFDGYMLGDAYSPVFAASSSDTLPPTFRPLFPSETDSWAATYALPLMPAETVRYFYIGDVEMGDNGPTQKLRVTQYKLEGYDAVRIGFNRMSDEPPLLVKARVTGEIVHIDDSTFGDKIALTPDLVAEVREACITPLLQQNNEQDEQSYNVDGLVYNTLTPVKTFYLDASVISGEPIFAVKDDVTTTPTDSIEDLVESEAVRLQTAFDAAAADAKHIDNFLQLTQDIASKKNRIAMHMPLLSELQSQLLVITNEKQDFKSSEKVLLHFRKHIFPTASALDMTNVTDNIWVIASQGLFLSLMTKNDALSNIVLNELLGPDFDITTQKNRLLIYNLACYYAIKQNKKEMLTALTQARKHAIPKEQFLQEIDFANYLNDPDFLRAIE